MGRPPWVFEKATLYLGSLTWSASQYGARALSRVLATIMGQTDNRVPLPQGYPGGDAAFFRGEPGLVSMSGRGGDYSRAGSIRIWGLGVGGFLGRGQGRVPWDPRVSVRVSFADMKQGLLSVGIGSRESRSGCLDVEKGEYRKSWEGNGPGAVGRATPAA